MLHWLLFFSTIFTGQAILHGYWKLVIEKKTGQPTCCFLHTILMVLEGDAFRWNLLSAWRGQDWRSGAFSVLGVFCQRSYCCSISLILWLFIFSLVVGYGQSWLQSLRALLQVTFIWRMLKHKGNNFKQQLQDIFHPKGHRKNSTSLSYESSAEDRSQPLHQASTNPKSRQICAISEQTELVLICYLKSGFGLGLTHTDIGWVCPLRLE